MLRFFFINHKSLKVSLNKDAPNACALAKLGTFLKHPGDKTSMKHSQIKTISLFLFHRSRAGNKMTKIYVLKYLLFFLSLSVAVFLCFFTIHLLQVTRPRILKDRRVDNEESFSSIQLQRRRSLVIFGHDRSGTTFISAMFAKDPQMFVVYEPLWITQKWRLYEADFDCSKCELEVVSSIISCNFSRSSTSTKFLSYVETPWTGALPVNIFKTKNFCDNEKSKINCPALHGNPGFVDRVCKENFKHSVVKVSPVRLPQEELANLVPQVLLENPDVDVRILHLVRDPRGNINSRISIHWVKDYPNPLLGRTARKLCDTIVGNLEHAHGALKNLNLTHRYKMVLYKQIADDPIGTAKEIYKFAGFEMPYEVEEWIIESTRPSEDQLKKALENPYSPVRNATGNADKWRKVEFFHRNRVIEIECKVLMDSLGLKKVPEPEGR